MKKTVEIANYFIDKARADGKPLTPMQLVKLVYIAHGWYLAIKEEPLIDESVQAWKYGPVIQSLYYSTKGYSYIEESISVTTPDGYGTYTPKLDETETEIISFLDQIWETYKEYNGIQLSNLTHQEGTPWFVTWHKLGGSRKYGAIITDDLIKLHYSNKIKVKGNSGNQLA